LKEKLERFKEERGIYRDYNETVAGILTESEREKLSVLMNGDQTGNYFYDDTEAQNAKEMYLPVTNDEKQE